MELKVCCGKAQMGQKEFLTSPRVLANARHKGTWDYTEYTFPLQPTINCCPLLFVWFS